jgi:hypothetical protein
MIELKVTEEIKLEATKHSEERMNYEYNRFGLSKEKRKSMILIGTIGQLVFKDFLVANNIKFDFEFQAGQYDIMDFKLNEDIVEIKTSGYDTGFIHLNLLYSSDQFEAGMHKGFKYCIQLFINGYSRTTKLLNIKECDKCVIAGYIAFQEIKNYPNSRQYYGDDYKVPIKDLRHIDELIKQYK